MRRLHPSPIVQPGPGLRWALLGVLLLFAATLAIALPAGQASAQGALQTGLSGDYAGSQDGHEFKMSLRQHGRFVTGSVSFADGQTDPLYGLINGERLALLRAGTPFEIWMGSVDLPAIVGEWYGPGGRGQWRAVKLGAHLSLTNSVRPDTIPAGTISELSYQIGVANRGTIAADDVVLTNEGLPEWFQITSIEIDRDGLDERRAADGTSLRGNSLELPLGSIGPAERVSVRISGEASPREPGRFPNLAVVTASNAERAAARTTLYVLPRPRIDNAFDPARIVEGFDGRVHYGITVQAGGSASILVLDEQIDRILHDSVLEVRGASHAGTLATGLTLFDFSTDNHSAEIWVVGSAAHLPHGVYPSTATLIGRDAAFETDTRHSSTATLGVLGLRPCLDPVAFDRVAPTDRHTDPRPDVLRPDIVCIPPPCALTHEVEAPALDRIDRPGDSTAHFRPCRPIPPCPLLSDAPLVDGETRSDGRAGLSVWCPPPCEYLDSAFEAGDRITTDQSADARPLSYYCPPPTPCRVTPVDIDAARDRSDFGEHGHAICPLPVPPPRDEQPQAEETDLRPTETRDREAVRDVEIDTASDPRTDVLRLEVGTDEALTRDSGR